MSGRSAAAIRLALAGGHDEQPWLWKSSTTAGWRASAARAGRAPAASIGSTRYKRQIAVGIDPGSQRRDERLQATDEFRAPARRRSGQLGGRARPRLGQAVAQARTFRPAHRG